MAKKAAPPGRSPRVVVATNYDDLSRRAADFVLSELKRQPALLLCASAGGSPTGTYARLAAARARSKPLFERLRVLQIDEWLGLPPGHPATCRADLDTKLLRPLEIPSRRFVGFQTDSGNPRAECRRISAWLASHGPIDVCILGLGTNGHIAMIEPADQLSPEAHMARLSRTSRNHPLLSGLKPKPTHGLTLGIGEILRSRKILLLVSGPSKRVALKRLLASPVTTRFPASLLRLHPEVTVFCDRAAIGGTAFLGGSRR